MTYLIILPYVWRPYYEECVASMAPSLRDNLLAVDNTQRNRGVAGSLNIGVRQVLDKEIDWMINMSASVRFGEPGGEDLIRFLESDLDSWAVEGGICTRPDEDGNTWSLGWKLISFPRRTLQRIGEFDENFWPRDLEDLDYSYRIQLACRREHPPTYPLWPKVPVDAWFVSNAHSIHLGGVTGDASDLQKYYTKKWGGPTNEERHVTPFGRADNGLDYWPRGGEQYARSHEGWS